jgi:hypothetical protein
LTYAPAGPPVVSESNARMTVAAATNRLGFAFSHCFQLLA